jgi:Holliday junction DNA helicase RuvA
MIDRVRGKLESVDGTRVLLAMRDGLVLELLCPAFFALRLQGTTGNDITLFTMLYLEGQGQGSSYEPRLLGFGSSQERAFFETLTSVSGIGNRKALRAMAHEPGVIARAIIDKDAKFLSTLPEIGKRMAERLITELDGKVEAFAAGAPVGTASLSQRSKIEIKSAVAGLGPAAEDAVTALMTLGQQRGEAEQAVALALQRAEKPIGDVNGIVAAVFAGRK